MWTLLLTTLVWPTSPSGEEKYALEGKTPVLGGGLGGRERGREKERERT
jgi:hypothetical protein